MTARRVGRPPYPRLRKRDVDGKRPVKTFPGRLPIRPTDARFCLDAAAPPNGVPLVVETDDLIGGEMRHRRRML